MKPTQRRLLLSAFSFIVGALALLSPASAKPARHHTRAVPASKPAPRPEFVYVVSAGSSSAVPSQDSAVSQYLVGNAGELQLLQTFPLPSGLSAEHAAMDPTGHFFYVVQPYAGNIICYRTTPSGALTADGSTTTHIDGRPESISFDPLGHYAYIKDYQLQFHPKSQDATRRSGDGSFSRIWQYRIVAGGSLKPLSPVFATAEGQGPSQLSFSHLGQFAYLGQKDGLSQYRALPDGTLAPLSPAFVSGPFLSLKFTLNQQNKRIYAPDPYQHRICRYAIGDDGRLTALPDIPMPLWYRGEQVSIEPSGNFAYIGHEASEKEIVPDKPYPLYHYYIYQYRVETDGTFSPLNPARVETTMGPYSMGFSPDGRFLYCASPWNKVTQFQINSDGTLQAVTTLDTPKPYSATFLLVVRRTPDTAAPTHRQGRFR